MRGGRGQPGRERPHRALGLVQVPDEPQFTVVQRIRVAAWVNPNHLTGDRPIVLKKLNNKTSLYARHPQWQHRDGGPGHALKTPSSGLGSFFLDGDG